MTGHDVTGSERVQIGEGVWLIRNNERRPTLKEKAADEAKKLLSMVVYLWVVIGSFTLYESVVLAQHKINFVVHGVAIVKALVLAKVMLIADDLKLARRMESRPLIYSILYQSFVFAVFFICFDILEKVAVDFLKGRGVLQDVLIIGGGRIEGIVAMAVIVTVALIPFFAFREIGQAIGQRELHALLFGRRASPDAHPRRVLANRSQG